MPHPILLHSAAALGEGRLSFVLGAGCSCEAPTSLKAAAALSRALHTELIRDQVLSEGECEDPEDLSALVGLVERKGESGRQHVVDRIRSHLQQAPPNRGYQLLAAMLAERVVSCVITLNFDSALRTAVGLYCSQVPVVKGLDQDARAGLQGVWYLHGTVDCPPDEWMLTDEDLGRVAESTWQEVIAHRVLATGNPIFVGLGGSAPVVVGAATKIHRALGGRGRTILVGLDDPASSEFATELGLNTSDCVNMSWGDLMDGLAKSTLSETLSRIENAANERCREEAWEPRELLPVLEPIRRRDLLFLGALRARWGLREDMFVSHEALSVEHIAPLVLAGAALQSASGSQCQWSDDGTLELWSGDRRVSSFQMVAACGRYTASSLEAKVSSKRRFTGTAAPSVVIAAGMTGAVPQPAPPSDILDERESDHVIAGPAQWQLLSAEDVCAGTVTPSAWSG